MNFKNLLTTLGSAFLGGAATYMSAHITNGIPTTRQAVGVFLAGAALTGLVAVVHLYLPPPPKAP
jgi:biotin transporter BioY